MYESLGQKREEKESNRDGDIQCMYKIYKYKLKEGERVER